MQDLEYACEVHDIRMFVILLRDDFTVGEKLEQNSWKMFL